MGCAAPRPFPCSGPDRRAPSHLSLSLAPEKLDSRSCGAGVGRGLLLNHQQHLCFAWEVSRASSSWRERWDQPSLTLFAFLVPGELTAPGVVAAGQCDLLCREYFFFFKRYLPPVFPGTQ